MKLVIDHNRINAAIAKAETTTSGEVVCVLRQKPYDYPETPLLWAFAVAVLTPLLLAWVGLSPDEIINRILPTAISHWDVGHKAADSYNRIAGLALAGFVEILVFLLVWWFIKALRLEAALTPRAVKIKRAHQAALEQFNARGFHQTEARTGVMIFAALDEHFVEVIADEGIYQKVDKSVWIESVQTLLSHIKSGDLTGGFEAAIEKSSAVLAQHFPPGTLNPNELPDILIEI